MPLDQLRESDETDNDSVVGWITGSKAAQEHLRSAA